MTRNSRIEGTRPVRSRAACASLITATLCSSATLAQGTAPATQELEEVVVTGIRSSLEQSIEIKRNADAIVDSIASEDLGKFPDANVAESMQRIPGVTITRNSRGEGAGITVRGFGPQFNRVLINGRYLPSTNSTFGSTGLSFEVLSAGLLSGVDVYKSSTASLQDGGVGALVNMHMPRPFSVVGTRAVIGAKESYEDLSGKTAPTLYGLFSDTFGDDRWGALASFSYEERNSRTDSGGTGGWYSNQNLSYTDAGGSHSVASGVFFPQQMTYEVMTSKQNRLGATGALQFRPHDRLAFTLDGFWNRYKPETTQTQLSHYFSQTNITSATVGAHNAVTSLTTDQFGHTDFTVNYDRTPTTIHQAGFNTAWTSERGLLGLTFDLATSRSKNDGRDNFAFLVAGYQNVVNWSYDGSGTPSLSTEGIPSQGIPANTYTDPTLAKAHLIGFGGGNDTTDEITEGKLDGVLNLNVGVLSGLKFGGYWSTRTYDKRAYSNNDACRYCGYQLSLPASLFSVYDAGSDFLGGGNFPHSWLTMDPNTYVAYLRSLPGNAGLWGSTLGSASSKTSEEVQAVYIQMDLAGELAGKAWSVNAGVRGVRTELTADGNSQVLQDLLDIPGDPTAYNTVYANNGAAIPVSASNDYRNLLPSLNARINITEDVVARFAGSKSLTRPDLADLSPVVSYGALLRPQSLTASSGNPNLKPYVSTNFDVSLEWYYQRGGYVSIDAFQKTVHDYIVTLYGDEAIPVDNASGRFPNGTATFQVSRPRNVETAKVKGLEMAVQHSFSWLPSPWDGFGVGANATFVKSPSTLSPGDAATAQTFALEGVGNSQNFMGFFEKGPIGIRVSYNHRDDYLSDSAGIGNEPTFVRARGQLDAQASYRFGEHVSLTFEVINLTDSPQYQYGRYSNEFIQRLDTGVRYALGARVGI